MSNPKIIDLGNITGTPFADILLAAIAGADAAKKAAHLPKRPLAQDIATLKAAAERYEAPNPFEPGDLVTPRADSPLKGIGRPRIVLELMERIDADLAVTDPNHVDHPRFGAKLDIRVASVCDCPHGEVTASWEEGWMFEPYTPPAETGEQDPAPASAPAQTEAADLQPAA
ncbi:hypothetical protein [Methylobacterium gossipiicola]|uniref:Uncharacterized protein n=1 Tax=Methylobacterium gossipiicola TaxID=582675 RepID=A0A1I2TL55_9HYPH|nr:hypothetical protein [Methylobacterium gossipiicola]SFG65553.1 hypothetical protein SAMN05192565_107185 [Methylobacterium gossipiicola]